jgi:hypothetical protein
MFGVGLALALALLIGLVVLPLSRIVLLATSIVFVALASNYIDPAATSIFSAGVRVAAVIVVLRLIWPVRGDRREVEPADRRRMSSRWFAPLLITGMLAYLVAATLPHQQFNTFILYGQGALLALAYAFVILRYTAKQELLDGVVAGLLAVIACSWLLLLWSPAEALLNGRLRGVTSNPNFLGFYCAVAVLLLIYSKRNSLFVLAAAVPCLAALVLTGSRGSLLIVVIGALGWLTVRRSAASRVVALIGAAAGVAVLVAYPDLLSSDDTLILRTNNSRASSMEYALQILRVRPRLGIGLGMEEVQVASTPLRALVHAGYAGGAAVALMYVVILVFSWRAGGRTVVLSVAMIANSLLEGWLLSPVAPMFLMFLAAWHAMSKLDALDAGASSPPQSTLVPQPGWARA